MTNRSQLTININRSQMFQLNLFKGTYGLETLFRKTTDVYSLVVQEKNTMQKKK